MHMADALISPEVGGVMWAVSGGTIIYCSRKVNKTLDDFKVPLMGVMGAFIFAAQMINFTIPGTGSSGHICGSILLSVLLGPYAAIIVIASVLLVQALIFADGGLLALGCNIFNMGIVPALIAYPLIYRTTAGKTQDSFRLWWGAVAASVIGLQLGAFSVVMETWSSGVSALPFKNFLILMLPIHLAIGFIEGLITASVLTLIRNTRPELVTASILSKKTVTKTHLPAGNSPPIKWLLITMSIAALLTGGVLSWFASENPDGLEWATNKITGGQALTTPENSLYTGAENLQKKSSILPDYGFRNEATAEASDTQWGRLNPGTTVAGVSGTIITLILTILLGLTLKCKFNNSEREQQKA
jgi:cobalt/nickel transport system permease protein